MAAVYPAGPDPMMIRSRTPSRSAGGMPGLAGSTSTAGPGVGWTSVDDGDSLFTGGTTPMVGAPFPGRRAPGARGAAPDAAGQPACWTLTSARFAAKPPSLGTSLVIQTST